MANTIVPWERLLYVAYLPPYVYEDGIYDGQAIYSDRTLRRAGRG
jgi:hypothetical protein